MQPECLAAVTLELQEHGCDIINLVPPKHVVLQIIEALPIAIRRYAGRWVRSPLNQKDHANPTQKSGSSYRDRFSGEGPERSLARTSLSRRQSSIPPLQIRAPLSLPTLKWEELHEG